MLKIRLQRVGRKHEPSFRVVLTDSRNSTKSGKFKEVLGSYDPRKTTEKFDEEKIKYWVSKGAQLSPTLHNILISHKIFEGKKINVLPRKSPVKKDSVKDKVEEPTKVSAVSAVAGEEASETQVKEEKKGDAENKPKEEVKEPSEQGQKEQILE